MFGSTQRVRRRRKRWPAIGQHLPITPNLACDRILPILLRNHHNAAVSFPFSYLSPHLELPFTARFALFTNMTRLITVAAAQVGAIDRKALRSSVPDRLIALLEAAASRGGRLVVFPETTFTTFFPRYIIRDEEELDSYFECESADRGVVDSPNVARFFNRAKELGVDVSTGYAEKTPDDTPYNTASYVSGKTGKVLGKYRKIHLPGTMEPFDEDPLTTNQLEKR